MEPKTSPDDNATAAETPAVDQVTDRLISQLRRAAEQGLVDLQPEPDMTETKPEMAVEMEPMPAHK